MVYDCFPFFNEIDILNLRLHIMDPYVDRFVIEESTRTFSGEPKPLLFERYRALFSDFLPKIDYIVVDDDVVQEDGTTPSPTAEMYVTDIPGQPLEHRRDYYQKNHLMDRLKEASGEDVIIFGDLDEIPAPAALAQVLEHFDPTKVYHLAQRNFYVFLNMEEIPVKLRSITGEFPGVPARDARWLGTKICSPRSIPAEGIVRLRDLIPVTDPRSVRVPDGGWHFGYMGGYRTDNVLERVGTKIRAAAHQEYNDDEIIAETMDRLILGTDIFGRNTHFERVAIDGTFPPYLQEHAGEYGHLILPRITKRKRLCCRLDLTAGRFCRKALRKMRTHLPLMHPRQRMLREENS